MIAADGRILDNYSLQVNESSLTGESTNVDKSEDAIEEEAALADRINMVYSGTLVAQGRAVVLVTATGMKTEMGKIAELMNATQERKTPLQESLDDFGKKLAIVIMIISTIVFVLRICQKQPILDSLMFAVALAVAAIPEALSSIVTIVQAMGTRKMAEENAIIKELKAVESLGCVSVICSDKTGTLTQNKMTVKKLYTGGYRIFTSIDLSLQDELQQSVNDTLSGYTGVNDEGVYELQASAVCIDNDNGYVRAVVGGRSQEFPGYTLNRAYQSFRQPGSAIKPLTVYTPSFEQSYTPDSIVVDEPIEDGPRNANGTYLGEITVRTAVEKSVNTIAWKLYDQLTPDKGLSYLKAMNFSRISPSDYRLATALGGFTNGVSALEMASGFAAIENDGYYRTPTCIVKIEDGNGTVLYNSGQNPVLIYKKNAARMMTDVLKGVITNGTGKGLDLGDMPCAGKTGTTNDQKDGWFVGYTRYYTTSVWVGYDMPKKLQGLMGNTYPGKIWQSFMNKAHEGLEPLEFLPYARISDDLLQQQERGSGQPEDNPAEETPEEETPEEEMPVG